MWNDRVLCCFMELIQQLECIILAGFCQMQDPSLNKTVTLKLVYRLTIWVFMELLHSISLMSTYVFIHLNTSLQFYFQCIWYNERERRTTSPGLIPGRMKIFLSFNMLQLAPASQVSFLGSKVAGA